MINRTSFFLIAAVITGILGVSEVMGSASSLTKIAFMIFLASFGISYLLGKKPHIH